MSLVALLLALAPVQYDHPPLTDPELAEQRGGFRLPNGIDVAMTVQTQTAVDGAVVLSTVFRADQGAPTLTVYTPRPGESVVGQASAAARNAVIAPSVTYDGRNGIQITPGASAPPIGVAAGAASGGGGVPQGLTAVDAASGVATDAGLVTEAARGGVRTVELRGPDLTITHFAGDAFGTAIANSGSDRAIDTQTTLSIDLRNAGPDVLGSSMLRAAAIADDAVRGRF